MRTLKAGKHLHNGPTEEADGDHHEPRRNEIEAIDNGAQNNVEAILGKPAIHGMECTMMLVSLFPQLLGVNLVDVFSGHSGDVQALGVDRGLWLRLVGLCFHGELEVPDRRRASRPNRAHQVVFLTIEASKGWGGWVRGKERKGFLQTRS